MGCLIEAHMPGVFCLGRHQRSENRFWGYGWVVVSHSGSTSHTQRASASRARAFVQKSICSRILFGNFVKQKEVNMVDNRSISHSPRNPHCHLSASVSPLFDSTSLSLACSLSLFLCGNAYFARHANDLPLLYSDARSVYTSPFHPHTNVLLLPLRPRAF